MLNPIVGVLVLAGCGGGGAKTVVQTVTAPTPAPANTTPAEPTPTAPVDSTDCDTQGLGPLQGGEGKCTTGGTKLTIVNKGSALKLHSLKARFGGLRYVNSVSDSTGVASATAKGTFVIITVSITNRLDSPQTVDDFGDRAALFIGAKQFTENFDASNQADEHSFVSQSSATLQPEQSSTGDFVFDVPARYEGKLTSGKHPGVLVLSNFGDSIQDATTLGLIRLFE